MAIARKMRLEVRLIPKPLFNQNLRNALGKYRWTKLRRSLLPSALKCSTCGTRVETSTNLHAHEEWLYLRSKRKNVSRLVSISFQCIRCHGCEHFGRTLQLARQGILTGEQVEEAISHFCKVNRTTRDAFERHLEKAIDLWNHRNRLKWEVDYGPYATLIAEKEAYRRRPRPKLLLDPARDSEKPDDLGRIKRGRPPLFGRPMSKAERRARYRFLKQQRENAVSRGKKSI